jgi:hypothetical protein
VDPRIAVVILLSTACAANEPAMRPELETPEETSETSVAPAGSDASDEPTVEVDLSDQGMAALVQAPRTAAVRAAASEIEIVSGPEYHLLIGRGKVDPLGEKARIVRKFDAKFRRFLVDEGDLIIYETGSDAEQRYHFFMTAKARGHEYHCRTPDTGLSARDAVDHLVDVCRDVHFTREADLPAPEEVAK